MIKREDILIIKFTATQKSGFFIDKFLILCYNNSMKIVKPNVEIVNTVVPGKKMEYAGRVCYCSFDKITDDSHEKFLTKIFNSCHLSIAEHERLIVKIDLKKPFPYLMGIDQSNHMKYFNISNDEKNNCIYLSSNIRGWYEATKNQPSDVGYYPLLKEVYPYLFTEDRKITPAPDGAIERISLSDVPKEFQKFHDSKTFDITCSRSASHQLVRHRSLSFSQQSQRYVNFSKDKFGHNINFILPDFTDRKEFSDKEIEKMNQALEANFRSAEANYFCLIDDGLLPEDARAVLPNATATQIIITGTTSDWEGFIKLRSDTHAQKEIRDISDTIKNYLKVEV
mgnify:CR=1 FL=1